MRWIYKLEYKFGRYYIPNLMRYIVICMGALYVLQMALPTIDLISPFGALSLVRSEVLNWQVWRLLTFVAIPPASSLFWILFSLYFYYMIGTSLESVWGGFRFNLYYLIGVLCAIISAFVSPYGYAYNTYLNLSLFLAFATLSPDTSFYLFFFLPIKAKWMALGYVVFGAIDLINSFQFSVTSGVNTLILIAFGLVNYLLFFGKDLINGAKEQARVQKNRRNWRNGNR